NKSAASFANRAPRRSPRYGTCSTRAANTRSRCSSTSTSAESPAGSATNEFSRRMSLLASAQHYFDRAATLMGLDDRIRAVLVNPEREVKVNLTIQRDNGQLATFTGYRVQHNSARGPMKGGLRYHPT